MKKIKINKKTIKEKSSQWLRRHLNDEYYIKAKKKGFRSRSAYKLIQINEKYNLFGSVLNVIDLGAAPGGWCQVVSQMCEDKVNILGVDKIKIEPIDGVNFIQGDLLEEKTFNNILKFFPKKVDILLSDMAPNTTGHEKTDHIRIVYLAEIALEMSKQILKKNGFFICKIFQGGAQGELLDDMKKNLVNIKYFKPKASRNQSSETYIIARKR